jgi:Amt family ammonium transporter
MSLNLEDNPDSTEQQDILDALPALIFLERAGIVVFANAEARRMLDMAEGEWVQRPVEDILWGLFPRTGDPRTLEIDAAGESLFHAALPARNGRLLPVEGAYRILNAELREAVIVAYPGPREPAPKSRMLEDVLASLPEAVAILHGNHVLYTNPAFTRMFGYTAEEASGGNLRELLVPETRRHEHAMLEMAVDRNSLAMIETVRANKNGDLVDVAMQAGPLWVNGVKVGYVYTYRDIGERKEMEAKLQHDAMHDVLTGLPNRALFLDRLTLALNRRLRRRDQNCGVLFVDLDRFKEINDTLGHAAGDAVLIEVTERLHAALRPQDTAARMGGDEFAILVENVLNSSDMDVVAGRVLLNLARPFQALGHSIHVGASIGAAIAGPSYSRPELLIRDADYAMYRAKQAGGGRFEIFDKHLEVHVATRQERERALRQALDDPDKQHIEVWYQPIYRLLTGKVEGLESELRWHRQDGSAVSLNEVFSEIEDAGLSTRLGRLTLDAVCAQLGAPLPNQSRISNGNTQFDARLDARLDAQVSDLTLTLNLSRQQFHHPDLIVQLRRTLAATRADPARLMIEVSETTLNENPDAAVAILQRMVDCNVRIAVDHFGAKLASLNHLVRLPIDVVKLDPGLTAAATSAGRQTAILQSLIHLGHTLGMQVVAEGIESAAQRAALSRLGCELGQGNYLSPALDPAQALNLAATGHWVTAPEA